MKPIEKTVTWLPRDTSAITLVPFILFAPGQQADQCVRQHEYYHYRQALRYGVLPWYLAYIALLPFYGGGEKHPMERPAYALQRHCEQELKATKA